MQRGGGGRDRRGDFFGFNDPFEGFGGFGGFGGGFRGHQSLISSFFGGRDPFEDPFFTRPLGPTMFGPGMFGPSMFGPRPGFFDDRPASGFLDNGPAPPMGNNPRGPVIEEINSDEEGEGPEGEEVNNGGQRRDNSRKHGRSDKVPIVEGPDDDDEVEERRTRHMQNWNNYNRHPERSQPQTRNFSFQSSTVTYGGPNGAYYTSSTSRRAGNDGVMVEESKEADSTTRKATHRISRGLNDRGHSVTRKLGSDGKVETMQMLHNLNEDELAGFDKAWNGNARKHLPGYENIVGQGSSDLSSRGRNSQASRGGWALPSSEPPRSGRHGPETSQ
ncbi:hypothetical protein Syun_012790 [Stephania yunnanensis]|uniref:Myeloid leukemia factor n=1 Tax=Stephania yunnanensis TaxID=152371 RepID=A0AAP0K151_9MAGN